MTHLTRRQWLLTSGAVLVSGASGCAGPVTPTPEELADLLPAGARVFPHNDESSPLFDQAVERLKEWARDQGRRGPFSGQRLAVDATVTDGSLVEDVSAKLGPGWRTVDLGPSGSRRGMATHLWQSQQQPERFYALLAAADPREATDGTIYRPLETMFPAP